MEKADLLEELKCELGLVFKDIKDRNNLYDRIIHLLKTKITHYREICVYLARDGAFHLYRSDEDTVGTEERVPFGEGFLSIVAARGEISCDFTPKGQHIYIPFYHGHFLLGEIFIHTVNFIDEDELNLIKYIQKNLNQVPQ